MAYVINGGDKPSTDFHFFVDLCCRAFNIIRKHGDLILHMLALMATAGIMYAKQSSQAILTAVNCIIEIINYL